MRLDPNLIPSVKILAAAGIFSRRYWAIYLPNSSDCGIVQREISKIVYC
jgi:hypothetical protein